MNNELENHNSERQPDLNTPPQPLSDGQPAPATAPVPKAPRKPRAPRSVLHPPSPWSKAARLPLQTRNFLNQSLRDGLPYAEISARLAALGCPGFSNQNISRWSRSPAYAAWLARQEQFENAAKKSATIAALTDKLQPDGRSEISDINELLVSSQLGSVLQDFDVDSLKSHLAAKPSDYLNLARTNALHIMARVRRQRLELDRLQYELKFRKQEKGTGKRRGGIPIEVWEEIEKELKLL